MLALGLPPILDTFPDHHRRVKRLIVDRGFISGTWAGKLKSRGIDTVIGLRSDMTLRKDMIALSKLPGTDWLVAEPPKYHKGEIPTRHIACLSDLEMWEACKLPLAGILIRDTYTDKTLYYTVVTTDVTAMVLGTACYPSPWA
jgi:hypothetical protein